MSNDPNERTSNAPRNQGEGNRDAAREFNQSERRFVNSPGGQQKIQQGTHVPAGEEAEVEQAEEAAKERAKAQDSNRMS